MVTIKKYNFFRKCPDHNVHEIQDNDRQFTLIFAHSFYGCVALRSLNQHTF